MVVGDQGAFVRRADLPVPPDRRCQGQEALRDPDDHAGQGPATVAFQAELVLEGVEGALDPLPPAAQRPIPARLIGTIRTQQDRTVGGDQLLEVSKQPQPLTWGVVPAARDSNPQPPDP